MFIAFEELELRKPRERLRRMSGEELTKFGKLVRGLSPPRVTLTPAPWKAQPKLARAAWRHGHPKE